MIPGNTTPEFFGAASASGGAYSISRSLRFNSADAAYLSRTPASAGNRKTWTWAGWVKRATVTDTWEPLFFTVTGSAYTFFGFSSQKLYLQQYDGSSSTFEALTTSVYRDPSAWYHVQIAVDTTQATGSNRLKLYINGVQVTALDIANYGSQNLDTYINATNAHYIGVWSTFSHYFDGYLADIYFIDGQALDPSSFTETDATTGQLIPKAYTGTYTGNSFWLPFRDNSAATATTLGKDNFNLGNNWTSNNLSITAGSGNDSLVDVPTNGAQTDTGVGGEVRGNYATLNPLENANTLSNGNLDVTSGSASWKISASTIYAQTGKWYCEFTLNAVQGYPQIGVYAAGSTFATSGQMGTSATGYAYNSFNGNKINNSSSTSYGNSWTTGDTIGIAYDLDNGALYFSKNGTWQNSGVPTSGASKTGAAFSLPAGIFYTVAISAYGSDAGSFNFGQRPFAYTAPSGFKALCTANLPAPLVVKPSTVMDVSLYTGNGSTQTISGLGFSPDLVWIKSRSNVSGQVWTDIVRGVGKELQSNSTAAETTDTVNFLTAFNSNGFSVGSDGAYNGSSRTYVAWAWDAGSSTVTNTAGSITSTVRANATAGFSVVTYTGNGTAGATVGHGLGVAPALIINKQRSGTNNWWTYHASLGATKYLVLDLTNAAATANTAWNDTAPTSTVFSIGVTGVTNTSSATYVSYCFAPVVGYSSFGSYTSNGSSDGPFVYTGFRPRWIMLKCSSSNQSGNAHWAMYDTSRLPINEASSILFANLALYEFSTYSIDILSNGFKIRDTDAEINGGTNTYIYAAFAESPFNYARAR